MTHGKSDTIPYRHAGQQRGFYSPAEVIACSCPLRGGTDGTMLCREYGGIGIFSPVGHEYVGQYYQDPSPWILDWKRHLGRSAAYWRGCIERVARPGSIGYLAPNLVAVARHGTRIP
jgi:hypothetical protein